MQKQGVHLSDSQVAEIKQLLREIGVASIVARTAGVGRGSVNRIAREMREAGELGEVIFSKAEQRAAAKAVGEDVEEAYSEETLWEAYRLVVKHGNVTAAARKEGMSESTLRRRYNAFLQKAERGDFGTEPVIPTFRISKATAVLDAEGNLEREFIQQKPARGDQFELPAGHTIKGVSTLVDSEGREIIKWIKTREDQGQSDLREAILAAFADYSGPAVLPPPPAFTDADLLTVYPVVDLHLGLYAWSREVGADYDLNIGSETLRKSIANLVSRSANSETALVLDLGDYFHADSSENRTRRSGNPLDVDTRYAKVLQAGYELVVETIELALQKHQTVIYRKLPGNHDDETSLMLAISIAAHFRKEPRVEVDTDPSRFFKHRFGKVMIAATHGDMLKMGDLPGFMATNWPQDWGETEFRYGFTGHIHHERAKMSNGVKVEAFNTLAAKDAWNHGMGFTSPRNAVSITMHKDFGEIDRLTVNLPMLSVAA